MLEIPTELEFHPLQIDTLNLESATQELLELAKTLPEPYQTKLVRLVSIVQLNPAQINPFSIYAILEFIRYYNCYNKQIPSQAEELLKVLIPPPSVTEMNAMLQNGHRIATGYDEGGVCFYISDSFSTPHNCQLATIDAMMSAEHTKDAQAFVAEILPRIETAIAAGEGLLDIISGPMCSGKSKYLIILFHAILSRFGQKFVQVFTAELIGKNSVESRIADPIEATGLGLDQLEQLASSPDLCSPVLLVDEFSLMQFPHANEITRNPEEIINIAHRAQRIRTVFETLRAAGKVVVLFGLDSSFKATEFETHALITSIDQVKITKTVAFCPTRIDGSTVVLKKNGNTSARYVKGSVADAAIAPTDFPKETGLPVYVPYPASMHFFNLMKDINPDIYQMIIETDGYPGVLDLLARAAA